MLRRGAVVGRGELVRWRDGVGFVLGGGDGLSFVDGFGDGLGFVDGFGDGLGSDDGFGDGLGFGVGSSFGDGFGDGGGFGGSFGVGVGRDPYTMFRGCPSWDGSSERRDPAGTRYMPCPLSPLGRPPCTGCEDPAKV